jgi:hypothetical protein
MGWKLLNHGTCSREQGSALLHLAEFSDQHGRSPPRQGYLVRKLVLQCTFLRLAPSAPTSLCAASIAFMLAAWIKFSHPRMPPNDAPRYVPHYCFLRQRCADSAVATSVLVTNRLLRHDHSGLRRRLPCRSFVLLVHHAGRWIS